MRIAIAAALAFAGVLPVVIAAVSPPPRIEGFAGATKGCDLARHVTLPSEGYRLSDGSVIGVAEFRHAVPLGNDLVSFIDRAGRARCLRVLR
jgi:hypothetical protein